MSYPQQRPERGSTLVVILALVAFVLVATLGVGVVFVLTRDTTAGDGAAAPTSTVRVEPSRDAASATVTRVVPGPTAAPTETVPEVGSAGAMPVLNGSCTADEAGRFGTAADGTSLVCVFGGDGFQWVQHAETDGQIHDVGDPCDPTGPPVSRTIDNRALMCLPNLRGGNGGTWSIGP